jgi:dTDP-4-amino-4,6-dideoxygalactose transaminase
MSRTKRHILDLAIFGGKPAFDAPLHVGRPNVGDPQSLLNRVKDLLNRKWLTNDGPLVQEFEQRICGLIGVKHCIAVCNATIGLEIVIKALDLSDEVIVPSFTFVATAHALRWLGINPVFCDLDAKTHNIDPLRVADLITNRTSGIIAVHVWGRPCDVGALTDLARHHNLKLIFDAAHAFGCSYKGRMIGSFGTAELFSFHATKFLNTFEGGAIVTNNDKLAAKIRLMRNFGFAGLDTVTSLGTNGKMSEASAAMGLTSLESFDGFIEANRRNYQLYNQQLARIPGISLSLYQEGEKCNYQYVVLEIDEAVTGISRDMVDEVLWAENVLTRRYFYPGCHLMEPYRTEEPEAGLRLPQTERLAKMVLCLPTGSAIGSTQTTAICALIEFIMKNAKAVKERLSIKPVFRHPCRSAQNLEPNTNHRFE